MFASKETRFASGLGIFMALVLVMALSPSRESVRRGYLNGEQELRVDGITAQGKFHKLEIQQNPTPKQSTYKDLIPKPLDIDTEELRNLGKITCKSWQSGNRTDVIPKELPAQMLPNANFEIVPWSTHERTNNPQSLNFCEAAARLGWEKPVPKSSFSYPSSISKEKLWNSKVAESSVSLMCFGAVLGLGPRRLVKFMKDNSISALERYDESVIELLSKTQQFDQIKRSSDKLGCDYASEGIFSESFNFFKQEECLDFFNRASFPDSGIRENIWMTKGNHHLGDAVKPQTFEALETKYAGCTHRKKMLVQRYMHNLLILDNRKWDARVFVLVASYKPLIVYAFDIFHIRASMKQYVDPAELLGESAIKKKDLNTFLTNSHQVTKKKKWEEHNWSTEKLIQYAREAGVNEPDELPKKIFVRAQSVIEFVFHTIGDWEEVQGRHRLYGFDFMVDKDLKPVLIDINRSPGTDFRLRSTYGRQLSDQLFEDALQLVHDIQTGPSSSQDSPRTGHFHLVYHRDAHAYKFWEDN